MKLKYKQERNEKIRSDVEKYKNMGFKVNEAFKLTAEKWFMSPGTVRLIYYEKGYYQPQANNY